MGTEQGELFLNLYQITRVYNISEDSLTLHLSDGSSYHFHGKEANEKLLTLLTEYSMSLDGDPLTYAGREKARESKIAIIRPEHDEP